MLTIPIMKAGAGAITKTGLGKSLISAIPGMVGGLLGFGGQKAANKQNLQIAREQMAFQERMSSTAYQRATKDLEASGLNRILALGNAASSPAGQSATMQNVNAPLASALGKATASALALRQQNAQLDMLEEQAGQIRADSSLKQEQTQVARENKKFLSQQIRESVERTRTHSARGLMLEKEAGLYDHEYGTAVKGVEKFLGPVAGMLGIRGVLRGKKDRGPWKTETTKFGPRGEYRGGTVTTRGGD